MKNRDEWRSRQPRIWHWQRSKLPLLFSLLDEGSLVASGRGGIAADKRLAMRMRVGLADKSAYPNAPAQGLVGIRARLVPVTDAGPSGCCLIVAGTGNWRVPGPCP